MVKETVVHPYDGLLLKNKKEWTIGTHNLMDESEVFFAKWKKTYSERDTLYDSICTTFWKIIRTVNRSMIAKKNPFEI